MRRILASLVIGALAWSFVAPLAFAVTANKTPACCRRTGNHHCLTGVSGALVGSDDETAAFRTLPSSCPYHTQIAAPTVFLQLEASAKLTRHIPTEVLVPEAEVQTASSRLYPSVSPRGPPAWFLNR